MVEIVQNTPTDRVLIGDLKYNLNHLYIAHDESHNHFYKLHRIDKMDDDGAVDYAFISLNDTESYRNSSSGAISQISCATKCACRVYEFYKLEEVVLFLAEKLGLISIPDIPCYNLK